MQVALDAAAFDVIEAASIPPYQTASKYCSLDAIKDPNRHQICADLVTMLTERSDTLLSLAPGTKMAERLDWPRDRLEALRDRKDAAFEIARRRMTFGTFAGRRRSAQLTHANACNPGWIKSRNFRNLILNTGANKVLDKSNSYGELK